MYLRNTINILLRMQQRSESTNLYEIASKIFAARDFSRNAHMIYLYSVVTPVTRYLIANDTEVFYSWLCLFIDISCLRSAKELFCRKSNIFQIPCIPS